MAAVNVDPEKVIARLSNQVGAMAAELAMRDVALEAAHARIAELENGPAEDAAAGTSDGPGSTPEEAPGEG